MDERTLRTPALVVDVAVMDRNIKGMADTVAVTGATLRPHAKTHKCLEIARRQYQAGASGITVATVSEAEVFIEGGFDDVFIAYPWWMDEDRAGRVAALTDQARIRLGCDSVVSGRRTAQVLDELGVSGRVEVLVEVDSGHHRSGVVAQHAGEVAAAVAQAGLPVVGVFTFPGHSYDPAGRAGVAAQEREALARAAEEVVAAGVSVSVISGGSSPSMSYAEGGAITEFRPGAYVFNDAQQWELGACGEQDCALTAVTTVVSHAGGRLILDVGSKVLGADRPPYASGFGRLWGHPDARIVQLSEHHAVVEWGDSGRLPGLGERVRVVPNHCCNAVNLADALYIMDGGRVVDTWSVAAGRANT
ncbi:alanine racemase [Austwickia sp. TVS 96-490-7B]|uniref:alanine racemase n=1 Tax=Austwickia sp. TVS 96-490-7B TaxID=2830843 RepID=UPI001C58CFB3|nr:alanine racemase [Austwickia sp. TVS 96-490-7B]